RERRAELRAAARRGIHRAGPGGARLSAGVGLSNDPGTADAARGASHTLSLYCGGSSPLRGRVVRLPSPLYTGGEGGGERGLDRKRPLPPTPSPGSTGARGARAPLPAGGEGSRKEQPPSRTVGHLFFASSSG